MAIMYSTFLYIQRTTLSRQDVGVQPEQVIGVVLSLDLAQALVIYAVGFLNQTFTVFVVGGHVEVATIAGRETGRHIVPHFAGPGDVGSRVPGLCPR